MPFFGIVLEVVLVEGCFFGWVLYVADEVASFDLAACGEDELVLSWMIRALGPIFEAARCWCWNWIPR